MRSTVKLNSNGRLVVPHQIRDELDLGHGDLVEIDVKPATGGGRDD